MGASARDDADLALLRAGSRLEARGLLDEVTTRLLSAFLVARVRAGVGVTDELRAGADFVPLSRMREAAERPFEFMELFPNVRAIVLDRFRIRKDEDSGLVIVSFADAR